MLSNEKESAVGTAPRQLSSNVVIKFQPTGNRNKKRMSGRGFFEHDVRNVKQKFAQTRIDNKARGISLNGRSNTTTMTTVFKSFVSEKVAKMQDLPNDQNGVVMNSKARRAAKYREMKLLKKIMLKKDNNFLVSPQASSCCCHCNCGSMNLTSHLAVTNGCGNVIR